MKKIFITTSLCIVAVLINSKAVAQNLPIQFGVKAGFNLSNVSGEDVEHTKFLTGFNVGITLDYEFAENMYIQTGLEFTTKGFKQEETRELYEITATAHYLQLPLHYASKLEITNNTKFIFFVGPYLAYGIGGKATVKERKKETFDYFEGTNKFDMGIGGGIGIESGKINLSIGYDYGLLNLQNDYDTIIRNQNLYLTIGYKF